MRAERRKTVVSVAILVIAWLIPVAGIVAMTALSSGSEDTSTRVQLPATVEVGKRVVTERTAVNLQVELRPAEEIRAQSGGTLTKWAINVGAELKSGEVAFAVNGIDILVHRGKVPFYRELTVGTRGEDVRAYGELLSTLGLLSNPDAEFGPSYHSATRELQKLIRAPVDGVFRPEYTVYVSPEAAPVANLALQVGESVEPGVTLATLRPVAESGVFRPSESAQALTLGGDAPTRLEAGTEKLVIPDVQNLDLEALRRVIDFIEEAGALGTYPKAAVSDVDGSLVYAQLFLELAEPRVYGAAPTAAVITSSLGINCIVFGDDVTSVTLEPSSEVGVALIGPDYIGRSIRTEPSPEERQECR